ncbi:MAG: MlaD family protein [Candidatus Binatia bacterium]
MAATTSRNVRVGALVAVATALLMGGTFFIGQERRFWESKVDYEIHFQRTNGLRVGSPVSLSGVDIGSVSDISFPEDPSADHITVDVNVTENAASRIRASTVARILTQGVLGDKYVELSPGSSTAPELSPGARIPSEDPVDYEKLLGRGGDIIGNIVEASNSLKNVFGAIDRGEGLLGRMLRDQKWGSTMAEDLHRTVANLASTTATIDRIAADLKSGKGAFGVLLKRGDEVERALAQLEDATAALRRFSTRIESAGGAMPRLLEDKAYGDALLADLRTATANLAELAEKANRGEGTLGRLVNDASLYANANELVTDARSSWVFSLYRGLRGIFPPYYSSTEAASSRPEPTPKPQAGSHWWAEE